MEKYVVLREHLGNRLIGYMVYRSDTKEFQGYTEKQIISLFKRGDKINGLKVEDDKIVLDVECFYQNNLMIKSGCNSLKTLNENATMPVGNAFILVKVIENDKKKEYEVVTSKFGRNTIEESKLYSLIELGCLFGGCRLENGKLLIAEGVERVNVITPKEEQGIAKKDLIKKTINQALEKSK